MKKAKVMQTPASKGQQKRKDKVPSPSVQNERNSRSKTRRNRSGAQGKLSPCATDYAACLMDPFDGPLACVPASYPPIPSFKARVWSKGIAQVGSSGYGQVLVQPEKFIVSDGTDAIITSNSAFTGSVFAVAGLGVTLSATNAPFTTAQIAETAFGTQYRLVALGIRAWYADTELNLSGEMIGCRQPDNQTLAAVSYSNLLAFSNVRRAAINSQRAPLEVLWMPVKPVELEYSPTRPAIPSMGIMFTGVSGAKFGYDVFGVVEYIGATVPSKTPSHADPQGFAAVLTAAQNESDTWYGSAADAATRLVRLATSGLSELSGSKTGRAIMSSVFNYAVSHALPSLNTLPAPNRSTQRIEMKKRPTATKPTAPSSRTARENAAYKAALHRWIEDWAEYAEDAGMNNQDIARSFEAWYDRIETDRNVEVPSELLGLPTEIPQTKE